MTKSHKNKPYFVVLIILTAFVFLEVALRLFFPWIQPQDSDADVIIFKRYHGSAALVSGKHGRFFGKVMHTDAEYPVRKNKHIRKKNGKWIFLGDSVTMGVGVEDDSTFSNHLQRYTKLDILNYSVIGYSARDYRNFCYSMLDELPLRENVKRLSLFWTLNDVYSLPLDHEPGILEKVRSFIRSRYRTYILLKGLFSDRPSAHYTYDSAFYDEQNQELKKSILNLCIVKQVCDSLNIQMDLVLLPYRQQIKLKHYNEQELVGNLFNKARGDGTVKILPVQETFKDASPDDYYLFGDGIHFSNRGHRELAIFLSKEWQLR